MSERGVGIETGRGGGVSSAREKRERRRVLQLHSPAFTGFFFSGGGTAAPSADAAGTVSMSEVETISKYLPG